MKETRAARAARAYDQYIPLAEQHITAATARRRTRDRQRRRAMNADPRSGLTTHDLTAHPRYRKMAGELRNLRKQLADRSEEAKAKRRAYKQSAPVKERARKWRRNRRPRLRDYQREYKKRKFGATPEPELCEICGGWSLRALALDHDHKTEKFRGWLCSYCNTGLGLFFDDPARLRAAADYLERNKA